MYFIDDLKAIALSQGLTFYHGTKDFQNMRDQKNTNALPACYLHLPVRGTVRRKKQGFGETDYSLEILMADKSDLNWEMDQHLVVIKAMEVKAHTFMNALLQSPAFREIGDYVITEAINIFDINLTGIIIETSVIPFDRRANCI